MRKIGGIILTILGTLFSGFYILMGLWFIFEGITSSYIEYDMIAILFGIALLGIPIILIGVHFIQKPEKKEVSSKKEEQYIVRMNGELYVKLGGDYLVGSNFASRIVGVGSFAFFLVMTIFFFSIIWIHTHKMNWLLFLVYIGFDLFMFYVNYAIWRPRIEINKSVVTCYPQFKKKKVIDYDYITYRKVEPAGINPFTIFRNPKAKSTVHKITYFHELEEIISINTSIQNGIRFDANVIHHMIENGYIHLKDNENES